MTALYTRMAILGAAATFAFAGATWAATPSKPIDAHPAQFTTLDTNHDGAVTKDELKTDLVQKDAKVSHAARTLAAQFTRLDADHNNSLSEAEFAKASWTSPTKTAMNSTAKKIKAGLGSEKAGLVKTSAKAGGPSEATPVSH